MSTTLQFVRDEDSVPVEEDDDDEEAPPEEEDAAERSASITGSVSV
jgi:hypothetical protein